MATPSMFPTYTPTWHTHSYPRISPTLPSLSAAGKTVLITEGGTGIGASIAKAFALAGASAIGIVGRREAPLIATTEAISSINGSTKVSYALGDVINTSSITSAFQLLADRLGKVDILVSNAGYLSAPASIGESDEDEWWTGFKINVLGSFNVIRAFLPVASEKPMLFSINTGIWSLSAIPGFSGYAASKAAAAKIHEYLQAENPGLHVVNVHPGVVDTEMGPKSGFVGMDDAELPGNFVVWLASTEAAFLKGKFVWVNWDVDELVARREEILGSKELELTLTGLAFPGTREGEFKPEKEV